MEGDLNLSSAPLAELCQLLGITVADLAAVEGADILLHTFSVAGADAARLNPAAIRAFMDDYGDAAHIEIRTGDLPELVLAPAVTDADITVFATQAASGGPYDVTVRLDKTHLAERVAGPAPRRAVRVFLFAEALRRSLERGISHFEATVWPEAPAPLVIAVLDTASTLTGPYLSVLGVDTLTDIPAYAAVAPPAVDFDTINQSRDRHIGWDTHWARALTPWHFQLTGTCADADLHSLLRTQLVKLAILFTCDRARARPAQMPPPPEILAEYRGREHVAVIPIDERGRLGTTDLEINAVLRAVDWCYQRRGDNGQPDWVSDRLPFVQTRIAQALEPHPEHERLAALTHALPYLLEGIEWQWKAFIEGKVGEYLDQVRQVETIVSDTVGSFADRAAALVKGLTDSLLAAVAVLIGSFIAAAFKSPFDATLFRIAILTYAGYVVVVPGAIGLTAAAANLRAAAAEFRTRSSRFNETLYPEKVTEIVGTRVAAGQRTFYHWLSFAAAVYLAVAILACLAAIQVPVLIAGHPAKQPTPVSTTIPPATTTPGTTTAGGTRPP